jgi:hypothetical protein
VNEPDAPPLPPTGVAPVVAALPSPPDPHAAIDMVVQPAGTVIVLSAAAAVNPNWVNEQPDDVDEFPLSVNSRSGLAGIVQAAAASATLHKSAPRWVIAAHIQSSR